MKQGSMPGKKVTGVSQRRKKRAQGGWQVAKTFKHGS